MLKFQLISNQIWKGMLKFNINNKKRKIYMKKNLSPSLLMILQYRQILLQELKKSQENLEKCFKSISLETTASGTVWKLKEFWNISSNISSSISISSNSDITTNTNTNNDGRWNCSKTLELKHAYRLMCKRQWNRFNNEKNKNKNNCNLKY